MAENNDKKIDKESSSGVVGGGDRMRNVILEEHARKYPEGDPSVRRISPDKGTFGAGKKGSSKTGKSPS